MLATLDGSSSRVSWTLRAVLAAGAVAVLALPLVYLSVTVGAQAKNAALAAEKEPTVEFLPLPSQGEQRILAALQEPSEIDFSETPLSDVIDFLQDQHGIPIQLDNIALLDASVDPDGGGNVHCQRCPT